MKLKFITSIKDYDLSRKERIFGIILKNKFNCDTYSEKVKVSPKYFEAPSLLDNIALWHFTGPMLKPQDILN